MEDPKVIAAIITASIALFLGLVNLIFNVIALRSKNKNLREIEKLKMELEKEKIEFQEALKKKESEEENQNENIKRILNVLQVLKDSSYSLINNLIQSDKQYIGSLKTYESSLSAIISVYQETYMDVDNQLRHEMHETKNLLHFARVNVQKELLQFERKVKKKDRIEKQEIENLIERVSLIQSRLLKNE